jgi:hypothetical protein
MTKFIFQFLLNEFSFVDININKIYLYAIESYLPTFIILAWQIKSAEQYNMIDTNKRAAVAGIINWGIIKLSLITNLFVKLPKLNKKADRILRNRSNLPYLLTTNFTIKIIYFCKDNKLFYLYIVTSHGNWFAWKLFSCTPVFFTVLMRIFEKLWQHFE